jgi:DNA-directed RNA polymerase subunit RPC12/RpoP
MGQPDWIEVGNSIYGCGECGHQLDMVYVYPETEDESRWLACPECGFEEKDPTKPTVENEWYQNRYSE